MRNTLRAAAASALVLSGLILTPALASAATCDSQPGHYGSCDLPECGPANEGQVVWGDTYQYRCSRDTQGYYWGYTGLAYV